MMLYFDYLSNRISYCMKFLDVLSERNQAFIKDIARLYSVKKELTFLSSKQHKYLGYCLGLVLRLRSQKP